jgi:hypothetical protein
MERREPWVNPSGTNTYDLRSARLDMKLTKEQAEKLMAEVLYLAANKEPGKAIILDEEDIRKILDEDN